MNQEKDLAGSSGDSISKDRSLKSEAEATKGKLAELAGNAAAAGKAQLDSSLGQAAGQVEQVAKVIDETAERLKLEHHEGLAAYASQVAGSIESVANRLRHSSVDELATEARQLAHSNPTLFLLGSVAVGFGLTRFLKASSRMSEAGGQIRHDVYGSTYGDSRRPTHDWESGSAGSRSQGSSTGGSSTFGSSSGTAGSLGSSSGAGGLGSRTGGSTGGSSAGSLGSSGSTAGSSTGSLASSTGSTGGTSGSSGSTGGSGSSHHDTKMFPEMNPAKLTPGGTVGGTRTNEVGGGSHG